MAMEEERSSSGGGEVLEVLDGIERGFDFSTPYCPSLIFITQKRVMSDDSTYRSLIHLI